MSYNRSFFDLGAVVVLLVLQVSGSARYRLSHSLSWPCSPTFADGTAVELHSAMGVTDRPVGCTSNCGLLMSIRRLVLRVCVARFIAFITRAGGGGNVIQAVAVLDSGKAETTGGCLSLMEGCILGSSEIVTVVIR